MEVKWKGFVLGRTCYATRRCIFFCIECRGRAFHKNVILSLYRYDWLTDLETKVPVFDFELF